MKTKTKISKNAMIGIAFLISLVMIYFGINFLKGVNIFKKKNTYVAVFNDVSGLLVSSPVYVKGYKVGLVNSIKMIRPEPLEFAVDMNLNKGFQVPLGTTVEFGPDLLGGASVSLLMSKDAGAYYNPGDTLIGSRKVGMMDGAANIVPKADAILMNIDSAVVSLKKLMQSPAWGASIEGVESTVRQLEISSKSLSSITEQLKHDVPPITGNLSMVSADLKKISGQISSIDLEKTLASIDETVDNLKKVSQKIQSTDNSLGKLLSDTQLHDSLNMTIDSATRLLQDIRKNPEKYLTIRLKLF